MPQVPLTPANTSPAPMKPDRRRNHGETATPRMTPSRRARRGLRAGLARGRSDQDEAAAHARRHGLGAAARLELGEDRGDVELDRVLRDAEARGDALVPEAVGDQSEDLGLARREGLAGNRERLARA